MTWDHSGANSYRMGAEGKYDLKLAPPDMAKKRSSKSKSSSSSASSSPCSPGGTANTRSAMHELLAAALLGRREEAEAAAKTEKTKVEAGSKDDAKRDTQEGKDESSGEETSVDKPPESKVEQKEQGKGTEVAAVSNERLDEDRTACKLAGKQKVE